MVVVVFVHAIGKSQLFTRCIAHGGLQRTRTQRDSACPERTKHNVQGSMYTGQTVLASHTHTHTCTKLFVPSPVLNIYLYTDRTSFLPPPPTTTIILFAAHTCTLTEPQCLHKLPPPPPPIFLCESKKWFHKNKQLMIHAFSM